MRFAREESGFTLIELVVVMTVLVLLMAGLSTMFVSGLNASNTTNSLLASQAQVHISLDRLEFEARCASVATRAASGADVTLTLPSQCANATGTVTWCVTGGSLIRYAASSCTGSGQTFASGVTSTTPFSCISTVGDYPLLQVALTVQTRSSTARVTATDTIAMRNAALTTATTSSCT